MATTVIFAEILIVGLQAIVWVALASVAIFGTHWIDISVLKGWESLATLFVLAIAYTLGIVVDRTADSVFHLFDKKLRRKYISNSFPSAPEMRLRIMSKSEGMSKFLTYMRSRIRIARSTAFNLVLIIISAFILLIATRPAASSTMNKGNLLTLIAVVGIVIITITVFAWARITKAYYRRLVQAYQIVCKKKVGQLQKKCC